MEKILNFSNKYGMLMVMVLTLFLFFRGCGSNGDRDRQHTKLTNTTDSLVTVVSELKKELKTDFKVNFIREIQIEGLKTEKRTLLNTNNIFLTNTRPDARYLEIDKEIKKLEDEKVAK